MINLNKQAVSLAINTVVIAALALTVLITTYVIYNKGYFSSAKSISEGLRVGQYNVSKEKLEFLCNLYKDVDPKRYEELGCGSLKTSNNNEEQSSNINSGVTSSGSSSGLGTNPGGNIYLN